MQLKFEYLNRLFVKIKWNFSSIKDFSNIRCGLKDDRQLVKMTDKMIVQILHEHNILRAKFARGEVEGYPGKVKRMSKLVSLIQFVSELHKN